VDDWFEAADWLAELTPLRPLRRLEAVQSSCMQGRWKTDSISAGIE
jgi:hypothetical protein